MTDSLAPVRRACRRGTDWLLAHARPDGAIGPVEQRLFYYRLPWTLTSMGETAAAAALLDWIRRHMTTPEGAFAGLSPQGLFAQRYGSYPLACLLSGAALLHRWDIVYPGLDHLLTWQDPESGGFYETRQERGPRAEQVLFPASQGGMTLLQLGQLQAAQKAGEFLQRMWDLQPAPQDRLHHVYRPATGLVTDCPPDQAAFYITRKDEPYQHHFNGGIAAAFLAQLHLATGGAQWLDLARAYQNFSMTTDPVQFQSMQTCKSGWGSGLLLVATGGRAYRTWTRRMGAWFVEHQHPDGHWENTKYWTPDPTLADNIELTAEFVMHLVHITAYLSTRPEA